MICPKCGREVEENSDFCVYCGASLAQLKTEEVKEEKEETTVFCTTCGAKMKESDAFCSVCGAKNDGSNDDLDLEKALKKEEDAKDLEDFIGFSKLTYYKTNFAAIDSGKKVTWNWCACLFGPFWCFYRKMIWEGLILAVGSWGISLISYAFDINNRVYNLISFLIDVTIWILCGLFANYLYKKRFDKAKASCANLSPERKKFALMERGGTNTGFIFLMVGVYFVLGIIENIIWPSEIVFNYGEQMMKLFGNFLTGFKLS